MVSVPTSGTAQGAMPSMSGQSGVGDLATFSVDGTQQVVEKRAAVVAALGHAWHGYERYAWGQDELKPLSRSGSNWIGEIST